MKHTLLATTALTALVAFNSGAFAGVTVSGSARIGLMTTEGAAAKTTAAAAAAMDAFERTTAAYLQGEYKQTASFSVLAGTAAVSADEIAATAMVAQLVDVVAGIKADRLALVTTAGSPAEIQPVSYTHLRAHET